MTKARDLANGGFGLVLIKPSSVVNGTDNGKGTVSFSSASTISLNDVFNSTYDNYKVLLRITSGGASGNISLKLRSSNSDASNNAYYSGFAYDRVSNATGNGAGNPLTYLILPAQTTYDWFMFDMNIMQPNLSGVTTSFTYHGTANDATSGYSMNGGGLFNVVGAYTGFSIINQGGNLGTGQVSVYGYNK
jgi:hypothetical protein